MAAGEKAFMDLNLDNAVARMPRFSAPMVNTSSEDPVLVAAALRKGLALLQTLASERAAMEEAVKELKKKENVLPKLLATPAAVRRTCFIIAMILHHLLFFI